MLHHKSNKNIIALIILGLTIILYGGLNILFAEDTQLANDAIKIVVKETSQVKQSQVYLGDISDIHARGFLKEALEQISICASPKPGKIKSIDKKKIISAVQNHRYLPENILVVSLNRIYVKRLSQKVSEKDIRQSVEKRLSAQLSGKDYQIGSFEIRGLEVYPDGNIEYVLESKNLFDKSGKFSFFVDVVIDGKKEDRINVSGTIELYENVFHSAETIKKGEMITRDDLYLEKRNIFNLKSSYIKSFKDAEGKILKTNLKKGEYLKLSQLEEPPVIKKGDIITLVAKNENLLILTSGISREDGFINKLIKVENLQSGKLVRGIVKEKSKVEVVY